MHSRLPGYLTVVVAIVVSGCGGGPDQKPVPALSAPQRGVLDTVDRLQAASQRGDGRRICGEIFTKRLAESVTAAARTSCAREVRRNLFSPDASLSVGRDIRLRGDHGVATVTEQDGKVSTLYLLRQAGEWRIDRVKPAT